MSKYLEFKQALEASGMSAKAYGATKNMKPSQVYYWLKKARLETAEGSQLLSVELSENIGMGPAAPILKIRTRYGTQIELSI